MYSRYISENLIREVYKMGDSPCKGCQKRVVGCKSTCADLLAYNVLKQPERERVEIERRKHALIESDRECRINHMRSAKVVEKSPTRCRKR